MKKYYLIKIYDYEVARDKDGEGILEDKFFLMADSIQDVYKQMAKKYSVRFLARIYDNKEAILKTGIVKGLYIDITIVSKEVYEGEIVELDDYCFYCHTRIKGKESSFPKEKISLVDEYDFDEDEESEVIVHFCSHDCKKKYLHDLNPDEVPISLKRTSDESKGIFGYVYQIYNRKENIYYIGQTRFSPFFRWQEHVKSLKKGQLKDLTFSIITEIPVCENAKQLLNDSEAWWINKYKDEGYNTFNIVEPKISKRTFKEKYDEIVNENKQESLF